MHRAGESPAFLNHIGHRPKEICMDQKTIENNFTYHAPKDDQPQKYQGIRDSAKNLAYLIESFVPDSREKSLAITKLEEAVFWANAGIARN